MAGLNIEKALPLKKKTLENGLEVVVVTKRKVPVICINIAYKIGSKDELAGKTGLAHLFEHLMFEGSANVPKGDFDKLCSMAGGVNNAYTTYDMTSYNMSLPAHQLELGLWLESDRMSEFAVTQDALDTQKKVVVEEIQQTVDDQPYGKWREKLAGAAFSEKCSYSWEVQGKKEHVAACELEDVRDIFNNFYQPNNSCLAICGDIEPERGFDLSEKYFGSIPNLERTRQRNQFSKEYLLGDRKALFEDSIPMAALFKAYHCPGLKDDEIFIADILANIIGSGRSSRIYNSIVYHKQLASMGGAFVDKRENTSLLTFYLIANSRKTSPDQLLDNLNIEIDNIMKNGVEKKELEKAINQLTTQLANELQHSSGIADIVANQALFWKKPERFYTLLNKYKEIDIHAINNFANKIFVEDKSIRVDAVPAK